MGNNLFSKKNSELFTDMLVQLKKDEGEFKIVNHLDKHLTDPIDAHVVERFDNYGNYLGSYLGD